MFPKSKEYKLVAMKIVRDLKAGRGCPIRCDRTCPFSSDHDRRGCNESIGSFSVQREQSIANIKKYLASYSCIQR